MSLLSQKDLVVELPSDCETSMLLVEFPSVRELLPIQEPAELDKHGVGSLVSGGGPRRDRRQLQR